MAERIRAGEDYDAVLADYDLHRRSSARAVAEKCAEIAAHAYDDAGPSQKEWVGAAIHIAREIRAYRDTHGAPLPATQRSEPVAWRWKWKHHGDWRHTGAKPREGDAIDVEPLYAAPLSETPAGGTAKPTGSWRPFKALEKLAHWTVIDENHETLFTCWRGEIDARRICELHALHKSTASPSGTAKVPEEAIRLLRWWLRTHGDEDGIPKPVEEATKAFLAAEPSPERWEAARNDAIREVLAILAIEDIENDPDDLYSGRFHRCNRIRAMLAPAPSPNSKEKQSLLLAPTATGTGKIFDTPSESADSGTANEDDAWRICRAWHGETFGQKGYGSESFTQWQLQVARQAIRALRADGGRAKVPEEMVLVSRDDLSAAYGAVWRDSHAASDANEPDAAEELRALKERLEDVLAPSPDG